MRSRCYTRRADNGISRTGIYGGCDRPVIVAARSLCVIVIFHACSFNGIVSRRVFVAITWRSPLHAVIDHHVVVVVIIIVVCGSRRVH